MPVLVSDATCSTHKTSKVTPQVHGVAYMTPVCVPEPAREIRPRSDFWSHFSSWWGEITFTRVGSRIFPASDVTVVVAAVVDIAAASPDGASGGRGLAAVATLHPRRLGDYATTSHAARTRSRRRHRPPSRVWRALAAARVTRRTRLPSRTPGDVGAPRTSAASNCSF